MNKQVFDSVDVYSDGAVTIDDYKRLEDYYLLGLQTAQLEKADVNGDGAIDDQDYLALSNATDRFWRSDQTRDGSVNSQDLARIKQIVQAVQSNVSVQDIVNADFNVDGLVSESDIQMIQQMVDDAPQFDINRDGMVDYEDMLAIFSAWGTDPIALLRSYLALMEELNAQANANNDLGTLGALRDQAQATLVKAENIQGITDEIVKLLKSSIQASELTNDIGGLVIALQGVFAEIQGRYIQVEEAGPVALSVEAQLANALQTAQQLVEQSKSAASAAVIGFVLDAMTDVVTEVDGLRASGGVYGEEVYQAVLDMRAVVQSAFSRATEAEALAVAMMADVEDMRLLAEDMILRTEDTISVAVWNGMLSALSRMRDEARVSALNLVDARRENYSLTALDEAIEDTDDNLEIVDAVLATLKEHVLRLNAEDSKSQSLRHEADVLYQEANLLTAMPILAGLAESIKAQMRRVKDRFLTIALTTEAWDQLYLDVAAERPFSDILADVIFGATSSQAGQDNQTFVENLFNAFVGRTPEDAEIAGWINDLDAETITREDAFAEIMDTAVIDPTGQVHAVLRVDAIDEYEDIFINSGIDVATNLKYLHTASESMPIDMLMIKAAERIYDISDQLLVMDQIGSSLANAHGTELEYRNNWGIVTSSLNGVDALPSKLEAIIGTFGIETMQLMADRNKLEAADDIYQMAVVKREAIAELSARLQNYETRGEMAALVRLIEGETAALESLVEELNDMAGVIGHKAVYNTWLSDVTTSLNASQTILADAVNFRDAMQSVFTLADSLRAERDVLIEIEKALAAQEDYQIIQYLSGLASKIEARTLSRQSEVSRIAALNPNVSFLADVLNEIAPVVSEVRGLTAQVIGAAFQRGALAKSGAEIAPLAQQYAGALETLNAEIQTTDDPIRIRVARNLMSEIKAVLDEFKLSITAASDANPQLLGLRDNKRAVDAWSANAASSMSAMEARVTELGVDTAVVDSMEAKLAQLLQLTANVETRVEATDLTVSELKALNLIASETARLAFEITPNAVAKNALLLPADYNSLIAKKDQIQNDVTRILALNSNGRYLVELSTERRILSDLILRWSGANDSLRAAEYLHDEIQTLSRDVREWALYAAQLRENNPSNMELSMNALSVSAAVDNTEANRDLVYAKLKVIRDEQTDSSVYANEDLLALAYENMSQAREVHGVYNIMRYTGVVKQTHDVLRERYANVAALAAQNPQDLGLSDEKELLTSYVATLKRLLDEAEEILETPELIDRIMGEYLDVMDFEAAFASLIDLLPSRDDVFSAATQNIADLNWTDHLLVTSRALDAVLFDPEDPSLQNRMDDVVTRSHTSLNILNEKVTQTSVAEADKTEGDSLVSKAESIMASASFVSAALDQGIEMETLRSIRTLVDQLEVESTDNRTLMEQFLSDNPGNALLGTMYQKVDFASQTTEELISSIRAKINNLEERMQSLSGLVAESLTIKEQIGDLRVAIQESGDFAAISVWMTSITEGRNRLYELYAQALIALEGIAANESMEAELEKIRIAVKEALTAYAFVSDEYFNRQAVYTQGQSIVELLTGDVAFVEGLSSKLQDTDGEGLKALINVLDDIRDRSAKVWEVSFDLKENEVITPTFGINLSQADSLRAQIKQAATDFEAAALEVITVDDSGAFINRRVDELISQIALVQTDAVSATSSQVAEAALLLAQNALIKIEQLQAIGIEAAALNPSDELLAENVASLAVKVTDGTSRVADTTEWVARKEVGTLRRQLENYLSTIKAVQTNVDGSIDGDEADGHLAVMNLLVAEARVAVNQAQSVKAVYPDIQAIENDMLGIRADISEIEGLLVQANIKRDEIIAVLTDNRSYTDLADEGLKVSQLAVAQAQAFAVASDAATVGGDRGALFAEIAELYTEQAHVAALKAREFSYGIHMSTIATTNLLATDAKYVLTGAPIAAARTAARETMVVQTDGDSALTEIETLEATALAVLDKAVEMAESRDQQRTAFFYQMAQAIRTQIDALKDEADAKLANDNSVGQTNLTAMGAILATLDTTLTAMVTVINATFNDGDDFYGFYWEPFNVETVTVSRNNEVIISAEQGVGLLAEITAAPDADTARGLTAQLTRMKDKLETNAWAIYEDYKIETTSGTLRNQAEYSRQQVWVLLDALKTAHEEVLRREFLESNGVALDALVTDYAAKQMVLSAQIVAATTREDRQRLLLMEETLLNEHRQTLDFIAAVAALQDSNVLADKVVAAEGAYLAARDAFLEDDMLVAELEAVATDNTNLVERAEIIRKRIDGKRMAGLVSDTVRMNQEVMNQLEYDLAVLERIVDLAESLTTEASSQLAKTNRDALQATFSDSHALRNQAIDTYVSI